MPPWRRRLFGGTIDRCAPAADALNGLLDHSKLL
jgi:hypothetical protein